MYSKDLPVLSVVVGGTVVLNALVDTVLVIDIVIVVGTVRSDVGSVGSNFPMTKCSGMVIKCTYQF